MDWIKNRMPTEEEQEQMEKAIQMATNFFITGSAKEREVKEDDLV